MVPVHRGQELNWKEGFTHAGTVVRELVAPSKAIQDGFLLSSFALYISTILERLNGNVFYEFFSLPSS